MCGLAGFINRGTTRDAVEDAAVLYGMGATLRNRGPDDEGIWLDPSSRIGLVHRRLSVIDITAAGHQPMISPSDRFILTYNGEVYNHLELRRALADIGWQHSWKGTSDTETLLHGFECWGIEGTLQRAVGMFALAIWDRQESALYLARDRLGEKPLYYGWQGNDFLFGSQLKALRAHPAFAAEISRDALSLYLRFSYVPAPYSIYEGIAKLLPGHLLRLSLADQIIETRPYWSASNAMRCGVTEQIALGPEEAVDQLETLLGQSVEQCMLADVPLGAFLSGGIDSSAIVALMRERSASPVRTFTIGYENETYSEARHAKAIARHLGTVHTELYVSSRTAQEIIPSIAEHYDEPFADSSQIPTMLVSKLASGSVTVALSGDGGDELFAGYNRYILSAKYAKLLFATPKSIRRRLARSILATPPDILSRHFRFLPLRSQGDKLHKMAQAMPLENFEDLYQNFCSNWTDPSSILIDWPQSKTIIDHLSEDLQPLSVIERMMALDAITYLPDDIMAKVDRASMAVSLECRAPFLDHRLFEFAWRVPMAYKIRNGQTKWILRQLVYRHVPRQLIDRPKMGFGFPIDIWLRGPLREWAEELLSERRLSEGGVFRPEPIRRCWKQHLTGERNWSSQLWAILMFETWRENVAGR
jgi:asparagine synthase (glutamine-hydrolysing)